MKKYLTTILLILSFFTVSKVDALTIKLKNTNIKIMNDTNNWAIVSKISFGNDYLYCVEPTVIYGTSNYIKVDDLKTNLVKRYGKKRVDLAYMVANLGHKLFMDTKEDEYYVATQISIHNSLLNDTYKAVDNKIVNDYVTQISELAKSYNTKPSFDNKTYEIPAGKSITINDTNKQLSKYFTIDNKREVEKSTGLEIKQKNNSLTISNPASNTLNKTSELNLTKFKNYFINSNSYLMSNTNTQDYASFKYEDSITSKVSFKGIPVSSNILAYKVDSITNKPINGVVFGLYNSNNKLIKQTTSTTKKINNETKQGVIYFDNIPYGQYYVKEISTLENYDLSDVKYPVNVAESKDYLVTKNGIITNTRKKTSLKIYKKFESINNDNSFIDSSQKYNATFEAYYDLNDNNIIDDNDQFIQEFIINSKDGFLLEDLNTEHNVLIKEISYNASDIINDQEIELKYVSVQDFYLIELDKYVLNEYTINNILIKEDFFIRKVDFDNNKIVLENATIEIYSKVNDKLTYIDEFNSTTKDSKFTFSSIYPEVCFIESIPPDDYLLDDTNYCFEINNNLENNNVLITNKKIPVERVLPKTGLNSISIINSISMLSSSIFFIRFKL